MMQSALRARLLADATVAALTGTRVDWGARPQGKALPAIVLQTVFDERSQHMGGNQVTLQPRIRVHCWASKAKDAHDLAEAVIACLVPAADQDGIRFLRSFATVLGGSEEDTDNGIAYRQIVDLKVTHTIP